MKIIFTSVILLSIVCGYSQDIHFSQFSETPLFLNPANAGMIEGACRASVNYKTQWIAMGNPYRTMFASYDMPLLKTKNKPAYFGIGGYFYSDKAGDAHLGIASGNLSFSAVVPLNKENSLSAGFQTGFVQRSASMSNLQFPNQYNGVAYDAAMPSNETSSLNPFSYFDLSSGINYQFLKNNGNIEGKDIFKINVGAAYFHINQPQQKFYPNAINRLYGKMVFNASVRYDFPQTKFGVVGSALFMSQGAAKEIDFGGLARYKLTRGTKVTGFISESAIAGGMLYRVNDAVIPQFLFEIANFGIGISYDVNVSSLSLATHKAGGLEISLKYSNIKDALFQNK